MAVACAGCLVAAVLVASAIGFAPTQAHWGTEGVRSMAAIGAICLVTSLVGIVPVMIVSARHPKYIGQAALGGTALRLLLTMGGMVAYQVAAGPRMAPFLFWAVVFYLLLLTIDTAFSVALVRRYYRASSKGAAT